MIFQTVTSDDFVRAFDEANRSENFTIAGRLALFDYLEDYSDELSGGMQLDVIGLCCQFSEYNSACLAVGDINPDACREIMSNNNDETAEDEEALEWLRDRTTVIEFDGGVIIDSEF